MLRLYHASGTRSVRVLWLCYELDVKVDVQTIEFTQAYLHSDAWRAISPHGKVPVLDDGDLRLYESGAITYHLLEKFDQGLLKPDPGTAMSAQFHQWCWLAESTLLKPLGLNRSLNVKPDGAEALVAETRQKVRDCLAMIDAQLADCDYLLGKHFTAADIMMGYSLELCRHFKLLDEFSSAGRYLELIKTRGACQRAMEA